METHNFLEHSILRFTLRCGNFAGALQRFLRGLAKNFRLPSNLRGRCSGKVFQSAASKNCDENVPERSGGSSGDLENLRNWRR